MNQPTHTHRAQGGRYVELAQHAGTGPLDGQQLIIYHDLDHDVQSATTADDWLANWREIARNDCPVCLGAGTDQIKGNKDKPCGGCYGMGKVRNDGEAPADMWELASIAGDIIQRQQRELKERRKAMARVEVREVLQAAKEREISDSITEQEQQWRDGTGHGPGGRRYTGD